MVRSDVEALQVQLEDFIATNVARGHVGEQILYAVATLQSELSDLLEFGTLRGQA